MSFTPPAAETSSRKEWVYVGTYANKGSQGIYAYGFDPNLGRLTQIGLVAQTANPSFLAVHPSGRYLYAVNELNRFADQRSGAVTAFLIDSKSGATRLLNQVSSMGTGPTHISLDENGKYALVANYGSGSVAVFAIEHDGRLGKATALVQHRGSGGDPERQSGPHAHSVVVSKDNRFALVADLGLDEVLIYKFNDSAGGLTTNTPAFVKTKPGAGPRHIAVHPNGKFVYVVNELQSTVETFVFDRHAGVLHPVQTLSTLPDSFTGQNLAAEISVDARGQFLYVSNRGHDSIGVFAITAADGSLTRVQDIYTGGHTPRNFALELSGKWLVVANQDSNNLVLFKVDSESGRLSPSHESAEVPNPTCLAFAVAQQ